MGKEPGVLRNNYKEVKNFLHNEIGITKEFVQELIKEMAQDEVKKIIASGYIENAIEKDINWRVGRTFGRGFGSDFESNVRGMIAREVGRMLTEDMKIAISKSNEPQNVNVSSIYDMTKSAYYEDK